MHKENRALYHPTELKLEIQLWLISSFGYINQNSVIIVIFAAAVPLNLNPRVINGEDAKPGEIPFQVNWNYFLTDENSGGEMKS